MKKFVSAFLIAVLVTFSVSNQTAYGSESPAVDAHGAILMDFETGRVLWEKDAYSPYAMASTTKIMTALLTLELGNLNDEVTVSQKAALTPPVKMFLQKDEVIKLEYLLYALMMQSSNDAAVAIAEHIGGTVEEFCRLMTERAAELGCKDTVFETPNGLDAGDHHSTAYDMALISRAALSNPDFIRITNTANVTFQSSRATYSVINKNRLLNEFEGANGIKTGYTGKAGHCFVGAAKRNDMQLISVVLASGWGNKGKEQKWVDTKEILRYGFGTYDYENIINAHDFVEPIKIERSRTPEIETYYNEGLVLPMSDEEKTNLRVEVDLPKILKAPIEKDEKLGVAKVFIGSDLMSEIDILAESGAARHDFKTSLEKVLVEFIQVGTTEKVEVILPEAIFE